MASPLILAGQDLTAGQGPGELSQYYGSADTNQTTVTAAAATDLSTLYTIPAGEPYAGSAYELACGGTGTWGSTQQSLQFLPLLGTAFGSGGTAAAAALAISTGFTWSARLTVVCADGVSSWFGSLQAFVASGAAVNPGTAADNAFPLVVSNSSSHTAAVSGALAVAIQAKWNSTTGAPTLTNDWTTFRKVA